MDGCIYNRTSRDYPRILRELCKLPTTFWVTFFGIKAFSQQCGYGEEDPIFERRNNTQHNFTIWAPLVPVMLYEIHFLLTPISSSFPFDSLGSFEPAPSFFQGFSTLIFRSWPPFSTTILFMCFSEVF